MEKHPTTADLAHKRYDAMRTIDSENVDWTVDAEDKVVNDEVETNNTIDPENTELEDIPDADDIQKNSPVDPAVPPIDEMHGIDLLNGYHGEDPQDDKNPNQGPL